MVGTDVGCVADVRHSLSGTVSASLCQGCYSQKALASGVWRLHRPRDRGVNLLDKGG